MARTAQQQAKAVLTQAQEQAKRIVARAQRRAKIIGSQAKRGTRTVGEQTLKTVAGVRDGAVQVTRSAVRLFRINLANTLTLFNGVFGFLAILASIDKAFLIAATFILCGVLCDWLDGKAARAFGEESPLGRELDSLSDLVTFGVAPAVLVAMIEPSFLAFGAGALFVLSAALRLGRFNVQGEKGVYFGVPTTTNGILLPALIFLGAPNAWFPYYLFLFALLMNAPIRIKKVF
jgi:CDP-diacylglycerol--serine O-phosphatidyltransferase